MLQRCFAAMLRAAFAVALCAAASTADRLSDECRVLRESGYKIAFFVSGSDLITTQGIDGTEIDLLKEYNDWAKIGQQKPFKPTVARLLLGYDNNFIALPYTAGSLITIGSSKFFAAHNEKEVALNHWLPSEEGAFHFLHESIMNYDFGKVDPATVTFYNNSIFAGKKQFDVTTGKEVVDVDSHVNYTEGHHFDLTHGVSVAEEDKQKTLVGVIDGLKVVREECQLKTSSINDCSGGVCESIQIFGSNNGGAFCFAVNNCMVASGPKGLFDTISIVPNKTVALPEFSTQSPAAAPRRSLYRKARKLPPQEDQYQWLRELPYPLYCLASLGAFLVLCLWIGVQAIFFLRLSYVVAPARRAPVLTPFSRPPVQHVYHYFRWDENGRMRRMTEQEYFDYQAERGFPAAHAGLERDHSPSADEEDSTQDGSDAEDNQPIYNERNWPGPEWENRHRRHRPRTLPELHEVWGPSTYERDYDRFPPYGPRDPRNPGPLLRR